MIDYEKLLSELNSYASYILSAINTKYGHFFSPAKKELLLKMSNDKNLVVIDTIVGDNRVHINPHHQIFNTEDYDMIKKYFEDNVLVSEILRFFITFSISEEEAKCLEQANLHQKFRNFLRNGFISYISQEFCSGNRLVIPEDRYSNNLEFIMALEKNFTNFGALKSLAFSREYLFFGEQFYEQTGEDILDFYIDFLQRKEEEGKIELLEEIMEYFGGSRR